MTDTLKVALLQREIVWGDPAKNRENFLRAIEQCSKADLYILPEMFSTGFCSKSQFFAEPASNSSLEWMKECALRFNAAIAGSIAIDDAGMHYNRFYFVKPDGEFDYYDKRHLFTYGVKATSSNAAKSGRLLNTKDSEYCCRYVTICVFPCFPATATIMTLLSMLQVGRPPEPMYGARCSKQELSKTNVSQ